MVRTVVLASTLAALLLSGLLLPTVATAAPNVTSVRDPAGDQRTSGPVPGAVARSIDIRRVDARREPHLLIVTVRLTDVRASRTHRQTVSAQLRSPGLLPQTFTTIGTRVTRTSDGDSGPCGVASRQPRRDTVTMELPFSCIRTVPGVMPRLLTTARAVPAGGSGSAVDTARRFRVDAR